MITSVERGPIGTGTAHSPVSVSVTRILADACATPSKSPVRVCVTRGPGGSCATPITAIVVTAKKMIVTKQTTRALTVSSGMSRGTSGGNGASVPQVVETFPSGVERV